MNRTPGQLQLRRYHLRNLALFAPSIMTYVVILSCCLLSWCVASGRETIQYSQHEPHSPIQQPHLVDGQHNPEYDHEAIIGSHQAHEEFDGLTDAEARVKLSEMVSRMDSDGDGLVTEIELTQWIIKSFRNLDIEEASIKMNTDDRDKDGFVMWDEFLLSVYGFDSDQMTDWAEDKNQEIQDFMQLVDADEKRFLLADEDNDGQLSNTEYASFLHPQDYTHMQEYELNSSMAVHDKNSDGFISFNEYAGEKDKRRESRIVDEENFKTYDINGDGKLDSVEVRQWMVPNYHQIAQEEAWHLISETDVDGDNKLTVAEILLKQALWVGSQATQALHLTHDPAEL